MNEGTEVIMTNPFETKPFRRIRDGERKYGTSLSSYINVSPQDLIKAFGEPDQSDGYKVSGEYGFHDKDGNEFTLYDWKDTTLYDSEAQSPSELWASNEPYEFHVGSSVSDEDTQAFIDFVIEEVA